MFDYKSLSESDLLETFTDSNFKITPRYHQLVSLAFTLGENLNRVMYLHGVGTGKTISALLTQHLWGCKKVLIICPISAFSAWKRDIKLATNAKHHLLYGSTEERIAKLEADDRQFNIINFEGLKCIYANKREVLNKNKEKVTKWVVNSTTFMDNFDCIIVDEIHKCAAYNSLQSDICYELSRRADHFIGLTGTVINKSELEFWNIYNVVDQGRSLGNNFWVYRSSYFAKRGFTWEVRNEESREQILKSLEYSTITFTRDECLDLPEKDEQIKEVYPSKEFLNLQNIIVGRDSDGNYLYNTLDVGPISMSLTDPNTRARLLRYITSGFIYYNDDNGERQTYYLKENPKIDALIDLLQDSDGKVIVYHSFIAEAEMIEKALKKNKISYITKRNSKKTLLELEKKFNTTNAKVFLAHKTVRESLDLTVSKFMIYYSPVASALVREQTMGRIYRDGQGSKTLFIDLILLKSVDGTVQQSRLKNIKLVTAIKTYMQNYGKN